DCDHARSCDLEFLSVLFPHLACLPIEEARPFVPGSGRGVLHLRPSIPASVPAALSCCDLAPFARLACVTVSAVLGRSLALLSRSHRWGVAARSSFDAVEPLRSRD